MGSIHNQEAFQELRVYNPKDAILIPFQACLASARERIVSFRMPPLVLSLLSRSRLAKLLSRAQLLMLGFQGPVLADDRSLVSTAFFLVFVGWYHWAVRPSCSPLVIDSTGCDFAHKLRLELSKETW